MFGGVAWGGAAYLGWSNSNYEQYPYLAGIPCLVIALLGMGYALVATAPVWLRLVVSVANALLGYMLWTLILDSMGKTLVTLGMAAVILFIGGMVGLSRNRAVQPATVGGHRAAR
jgi:hypothetical protein